MTLSDNTTSDDQVSQGAGRAFEALILSIILVVAITGNVSIWIIVLKSKVLRTVTNMFMLGLSAADLLVSTVNMPVTVVAISMGYWPLSNAACTGFGFTNMLTLVTSVLSLCNISINRYVMVCRPASFKWIYTTRNAVLMITAVFLVSFLLSTPPLYGWGEYAYIPIQSFCFADWANHVGYAYFMIGCCFGVPCGVMMVCNVFIYLAVRKSRLRISQSKAASLRGSAECTKKTLFSVIPLSRDNSTHSDVSSPSDILVKRPSRQTETARDSDHLHVYWKETIQVKSENGVAEPDTDNPSVDGTARESLSVDRESLSVDGTARESPSTTDTTVHTRTKKKRKKVRRSEEIRLAMCLIIVVICFVLCWLPYCISMLLSIYCRDAIPRGFHMFTLLIGYANSGCNPIIYGLMNKRYAAGFRDLYCWFRRGRRGNMSMGSSTDGEATTDPTSHVHVHT